MLVGKAQRVFRVSEKNREAGMKKVIELLEQAKALIWNPPTLEVEKKFLDVTVSKIIEEAISELQALTNGETLEPVQVLNHVIYETTEALKFLDIAPCPDRDIGNVIEYNLEDGIDRLRNLIGAINKPRWETPEQWEQRTGEPWHGNWAVYVRLIEENYRGPDSVEWAVNTYKNVRKWHDDSQIVCATEAGPPPNNWRPEEEK
jgi:hypothetical protein